MSEHQEQVKVFDVLRLNEAKHPYLAWIYAIPNGSARHPVVGAKLKLEGVKKGVADICIPFACAHSFREPSGSCCNGAYIEMKYGKNKLTQEQQDFKAFVEQRGYLFTVCYSADEALDVIERYCGIKLRGRK